MTYNAGRNVREETIAHRRFNLESYIPVLVCALHKSSESFVHSAGVIVTIVTQVIILFSLYYNFDDYNLAIQAICLVSSEYQL
jgi:hypothetical protein